MAVGFIVFSLSACSSDGGDVVDEIRHESDFVQEFIRCTDPETGAVIEDRHDDCHLDG
ncbi:hypothetical protein [Geodermatophilus normandii]|nr:hypothetical protein [Geodermatophilus normandii]